MSKAHVGHAMSAIVFDMVRRYLQYKGYEVIHVMNFTDVDDKIIKRGHETGDDPFAISQRYVDEFHRHIGELRVLPATVYPRVSDTIPEIVEMVQMLQENRYAYATEGDVYFRVRQDEDYGKLSRRKLDEVLAGTRVQVGDSKEDPNDFALWKGQKPGEPAWESPWGPGRPGWHIECSAMALKHLGEQIDIHGGGNDLIFPSPRERDRSERMLYRQAVCPLLDAQRHVAAQRREDVQEPGQPGHCGRVSDRARGRCAAPADPLQPVPQAADLQRHGDRGHRAWRWLACAAPCAPPLARPPAGGDSASLAAAAAQAAPASSRSMDDDFNTAGALGCLYELVTAINRARDAGVGGAAFRRGSGYAAGAGRRVGAATGCRAAAHCPGRALYRPAAGVARQATRQSSNTPWLTRCASG
jgi:cysteinyl-tRNA synthetase